MTADLTYESGSAWKKYAAPGAREQLYAFARDYIDFLNACKTERETVAWACRQLRDAGYEEDFGKSKILRPFREKCLFAASAGRNPASGGLNLVAAHADSPRLDFKQHPFVEQAGIVQAKTHYYGGIRKYQWLARPLALHGVVVLENGQKIHVSIGDQDGDPVFCVADLLPHLAQKQASVKLSEAFEAEKLNIVIGHEPLDGEPGDEDAGDEGKPAKDAAKKGILQLLHARYGLKEEDFITAELEAVPAGKAAFVGLDQSMVGGYGQDDRICVFCAVRAMLAASPARPMALVVWDKEEIGSDGATGASSRFFQYCMEDLARAWGVAPSTLFLQSRALSADVTAALDPDYQDVHDRLNAALLGHGPCFSKFTGSRGKYGASEADAEFFAMLRGLFNSAGIPWQAAELGKVDLGGGGTVALFLAALGMQVIDLGPALLSMHSPFELSSVADLYATGEAYRAFYEQTEA